MGLPSGGSYQAADHHVLPEDTIGRHSVVGNGWSQGRSIDQQTAEKPSNSAFSVGLGVFPIALTQRGRIAPMEKRGYNVLGLKLP